MDAWGVMGVLRKKTNIVFCKVREGFSKAWYIWGAANSSVSWMKSARGQKGTVMRIEGLLSTRSWKSYGPWQCWILYWHLGVLSKGVNLTINLASFPNPFSAARETLRKSLEVGRPLGVWGNYPKLHSDNLNWAVPWDWSDMRCFKKAKLPGLSVWK